MSESPVEQKSGLNPFVAVIVAIAVLAVIVFVLGQKESFETVEAGSEAKPFVLPDLDGVDRSLDDYLGKVVFLNFWATWCVPCEDEMPSMQHLRKTLDGKPFEIVAVSVDTEGADVVRKFVKKHNLTFPVLHDRKGRVKDAYKTTGVPETFIIDQRGVIAEKVWGPRDWSAPTNTKSIMDLIEKGAKPDPSSPR
jgi:peroxiredoxin